MVKQIAFLMRPTRIILTLVALMCLLALAEAQHSGGGGHSAGGHFGGGHSSGRHSGGSRTGGWHSGWLHVGFGNRARRRGGRPGTVDTPRHLLPELAKGATPVRAAPWASIQPAPQRPLWFPVLFHLALSGIAFSFLLGFAVVPVYSSAAFRVFGHRVASSTVSLRFVSSSQLCRCFSSPPVLILLLLGLAFAATLSVSMMTSILQAQCSRETP